LCVSKKVDVAARPSVEITRAEPAVVPGANGPSPLAEGPARSAVAEGPATSAPAETATTAAAPVDVMYVHGPTESGEGFHVLRQRQDRIEVGQIRGLRAGVPLHGEVVRLKPREGQERLFDVDVLVEAPSRRAHDGPPQVASESYRHNWDAVFGRSAQLKRARDSEPN
jgi:hypothetical protein